MPRISEFYGIVVSMYWSDHLPLHFHARYSGDDAGVDLVTGEVLWVSLPPRARRLVREWTALHQTELLANWRLAQAQQPLVPVDPLP